MTICVENREKLATELERNGYGRAVGMPLHLYITPLSLLESEH